jgi:hypothetical protein
MRLRAWWFVGLGVVSLAFLVGSQLDLPSAIGDEPVSFDSGLAQRSLVYRVPAQGELTFDVPPGTSLMRLVTNAEISDQQIEEEPAAGWRYSLKLEVESWGERASSSRVYHFRSRLPRSERLEDGGQRPDSGYLRSSLRPLDGRLVPLRLDNLGFRPAQLKIGLATMDEEVAGVSVRVYFREKVNELKRHAMWPRLSLQEREHRAEGNVYPHDLLSEDEKQALVRYLWSPLSPSGVEGVDFDRRVLLQAAERRSSTSTARQRPIGLALRPGVRGVIRVPEPTNLRLEALALDDETKLEIGELALRFLDVNGYSRRDLVESRRRRGDGLEISLPSGWLEVTVPVRAVVGVSMGDGSEESFTPLEPESILGYACDPQSVLEYRVVSLESAATPFRIDLRSEGSAPTASADYRILASDGRPISTGTMAHEGALSVYDWADGHERSERVSEPSRHYLSLPPGAASLELSNCTSPLIVTAYNHPPDLVWHVAVPAAAGRQPSRRWFRLRPLAADARKERGESRMLRLQERPPEPIARLAEEGIRSESFDLGDDAVGRYVLVARGAGSGSSATGLTSGFVELREGSANDVVLTGGRAGGSAGPTLLFRRLSPSPFRLLVEVDGRSLIDEERVGVQGEIALPAVTAGRHRIRLSGDASTTFLLSRVGDSSERVYSRRFVYRLSSGPFELSVRKARPQVVTGRLYFPEGSDPGCSLDVEILGLRRPRAKNLTAWTFRRRVYEVGLPMDSRVAALGGERLWMHRSHPFFVGLGEDLPPGDYRLRFSPRCAAETYITLSRLVPESTEQRRFFLETELRALGS